MIVPPGSHFTGWTSDYCCPSHRIQRMVGTPCPAERSSYHTGCGVQQLPTNGEASVAFLRMLEWGIFILLIACGCLLLFALRSCLASSGIFPRTSTILFPHPAFRLEVRPSTKKLQGHPGCLAQMKEDGHFLSLCNYCESSGWTQHIPWITGCQELPSLWLRGIKPSHVLLTLWTLDHHSDLFFYMLASL